MQRTIYDFLIKKYDVSKKKLSGSMTNQLESYLKKYWFLKILGTITFFALFMLNEKMRNVESFKFVGEMLLMLLFVTVAYFKFPPVWYMLSLSPRRKWLDYLLMGTGIVLCLNLPVFTIGDYSANVDTIQLLLKTIGAGMIILGIYRRLHYQQSGIVWKCAVFAGLLTIGMLGFLSWESISQNIYLSFLLLVNSSFIADFVFSLFLKHKVSIENKESSFV